MSPFALCKMSPVLERGRDGPIISTAPYMNSHVHLLSLYFFLFEIFWLLAVRDRAARPWAPNSTPKGMRRRSKREAGYQAL